MKTSSASSLSVEKKEARKRGLMALSGGVFLTCAVLANVPKVHLPFLYFGIFNRWDMFVNPETGHVAVVLGTPRDGGPQVVVDDPIDGEKPFLDRLRDQRQRKLHSRLQPTLLNVGARQSYLAYKCRIHEERYSKLELVIRTKKGALGPPFAEEKCEAKP